MSPKKVGIVFVLATFVPFTVWVALTGSNLSEVSAAFAANPWPIQITVDLMLALALVCIWMWRDARRLGRNPLPWILATSLTGTIGPLIYLLTRPEVPMEQE